MIDKDILNAIDMLSKRLSRRCWSESPEDLVQDGIVLVLELYRKNPHADKEWIYKALHNFYASKRKKIRNYEYRGKALDEIPEVADIVTEQEEELDDVELEIIRLLAEAGLSRSKIVSTLGISERTLYTKLKKVRDANSKE